MSRGHYYVVKAAHPAGKATLYTHGPFDDLPRLISAQRFDTPKKAHARAEQYLERRPGRTFYVVEVITTEKVVATYERTGAKEEDDS